MKATKILNDDIGDMLISSLPTRPTTPTYFGGKGYSAKEIKEAFDKLPLYIVEKFNALIDDVSAVGEDSLAASIRTGIDELHTLSDLFSDVKSGEFCAYAKAPAGTLSEYLLALREDIDLIKSKLGI